MLLTRFAPTPSGYLHIGNVFSFILTWLLARLQGGSILLRIDDLDNERFRAAYLEDIFYTLDWLELDYDLGPQSVADFYANWSQQHRIDLYRQALDALQPYLFTCTCSRKRWQAATTDGMYPGTCLSNRQPFSTPEAVWRLYTPPELTISFLTATHQASLPLIPYRLMRHPVVRRKDKLPAYQIASVIDDCHFDVNFVVRGQDLLASTALQCYLAQCLGKNHFATIAFHHHPLLRAADGTKLSKSVSSPPIREMALAGGKPADIYRQFSAILCPNKPPANSARELLQQVAIDNILQIENLQY
ncbi:glutamate--tRNA ligase family protein [Rhodoflexus sp.]